MSRSSDVNRLNAESSLQGNVLIDDEGRARLTDYELTTFRDTSKVNFSLRGVNVWEAPELIRPSLFGTSGHPTFETDIYAFACTIYEVRFTLPYRAN